MKDDPAHELDVEVALADGPPGGLPHAGERLGEEVLKVLTPVQAFAELDRLVCEVAGREFFDLRLERIGELDVFLEPFALSAFAERPELFDDGQVRTPR